eukprot:60304_1
MPFRKGKQPVWFSYQPENLNASEPPNPGQLAEILARILKRTQTADKLKMIEKTSLRQLKHHSRRWLLRLWEMFEAHSRRYSSEMHQRMTTLKQRLDRHRANTEIISARLENWAAQSLKRIMEEHSMSQQDLCEYRAISVEKRRRAHEQETIERLLDELSQWQNEYKQRQEAINAHIKLAVVLTECAHSLSIKYD